MTRDQTDIQNGLARLAEHPILYTEAMTQESARKPYVLSYCEGNLVRVERFKDPEARAARLAQIEKGIAPHPQPDESYGQLMDNLAASMAESKGEDA